jgi:two-component system OmpR family response regulator
VGRQTVLVVDDDPRLRELVRYALERGGYAVAEAADGDAALREIAARRPDLVVLDVHMPGPDGLEVCRRVRGAGDDTPIVFLTSRDQELDQVLGLELGGDDWVAKPFLPAVLVSRVRAVLRRPRGAVDPGARLVDGPLSVDVKAHRATVDGVELGLTPTELRLVAALLRRRGVVLTRDELARQAYEGRHFVSDRTLNSHIRGVRAKLVPHDLDPIETVFGVGYRWRAAG